MLFGLDVYALAPYARPVDIFPPFGTWIEKCKHPEDASLELDKASDGWTKEAATSGSYSAVAAPSASWDKVSPNSNTWDGLPSQDDTITRCED